MTRIALPSWIIAIALAGYLHLATAQNPAYVPQSVVGAKVGFPTNFTCQSNGVPIQTCLWERDGPASSGGSGSGTLIINFNPANARQGESPVKGYSYLGDGLEKGECGITIQTVKEEDNGSWKCTLIASTGLFRGVVDLGILKKPGPPKFNPSILSKLVDSDDMNSFITPQPQPSRIVCFSGNGQPPPRFQWFIDEQPLTEGLTPINTTTDVDTGIPYTFQELVNHRFTWRDNGKKLRCVSIHDALGPNDQKEVAMDIDIQYAPRSAREEDGNNRINVRAELGAEQILSVNISANPRPSTVVWNVDNKPIREGENNDKYDAMIIKEVESGIWETNLRIKSVEEEDVNKNFVLTVTNDFGEAQFNLYVASEATGSGGLSAGGIVLLILGIAALIIIIALVVVYARAQGLLCFKGRSEDSHSTAQIDGKNSDLGESGGNENPVSGDGGGYPPSQTPPLGPPQSKQNGNMIPPPAPTIPPPPLDDDTAVTNPPPSYYTNGNGRAHKDSPV